MIKRSRKIPMRINFKGDEFMPNLQFNNFTATLVDESKGKATISFDITGISKVRVFVDAFMLGKTIIEGIQSHTGTMLDYMYPIMTFVTTLVGAFKKSQ